MKIIFSVILSLLFSSTIFAQEASTLPDSTDIKPTYKGINLLNIELPPVAVFLDAAKNYADVKISNERINELIIKQKEDKRDWLSYIRLQGNFQYGTTNAISTQAGEIAGSNFSNYTTNVQSWYNGGLAVSIPLDDLFSRKLKNSTAKSRVKQMEYESERAIENRQIIILQSYNEVIKHLAILKVKAEAVALYDAQMRVSESDFINGKIDIISLSLERARRAEANVSYQESRAALHNAVTILEMLTKVKIIK